MDELEKLFIDKLNIKTTEAIEPKEKEPVHETIEIKEVIEPTEKEVTISGGDDSTQILKTSQN